MSVLNDPAMKYLVQLQRDMDRLNLPHAAEYAAASAAKEMTVLQSAGFFNVQAAIDDSTAKMLSLGADYTSRRQLSSLAADAYAASSATAFEEIIGVALRSNTPSYLTDAITRSGAEAAYFSSVGIAASSTIRGLGLDHFDRPELAVQAELARQVAEAIAPPQRLGGDIPKWEDQLAFCMSALPVGWALKDDYAVSGMAFGELARLSDAVRFGAPFDPEVSGYAEQELGQPLVEEKWSTAPEERESGYDNNGRNPALVAFPPRQFAFVLSASGLTLDIPPPRTPQPIENGQGPAVYGTAHHEALRSLELHLREFIASKLSALDGPNWFRKRVQGKVWQGWINRQSEARDKGYSVFEPIHYSNFGELQHIVLDGRNWEVFRHHFVDRGDFEASFNRLTPLRNHDGHHRPFCSTEELTLFAEMVRLLRAIGTIS